MTYRPVILIDVDSVVADMMPECLKRYNADWSDSLTVEDLTDWDLRKFVKPECGSSIYDYFQDPSLYENCKPVTGAVCGVNVVRSLGGRVVFLTSCLPHSFDAKWEWLKRHGLLDYKHSQPDLIAASDKGLICGDAMVDDGLHNLHAFRSGARILFAQPWNRVGRESPILVAHSWGEVIVHLKRTVFK